MLFYNRALAADLPFGVGENQPDGSRRSNGTPGFLSFGPYIKLRAGRYTAGFFLRRDSDSVESGQIKVDVSCDSGTVLVAKKVPTDRLSDRYPALVAVEFNLDAEADEVEVRLECGPVEGLILEEMVIFQRAA
jgi:hypothetical protein